MFKMTEILLLLMVLCNTNRFNASLLIQNDIKEFNRRHRKEKERKELLIRTNKQKKHHSVKRKIDINKKLYVKKMLKDVFWIEDLPKYDENAVQKIIEWYKPIRWVGDRNKNRDRIRKSEREINKRINRMIKEGIDVEEVLNNFEEDGVRVWHNGTSIKDRKKVYNSLDKELKEAEEIEKAYRTELSRIKVDNLKMMITLFDPVCSDDL